MEPGTMEVTIKVRTVPFKKAVLRQLPVRYSLSLNELEHGFVPVCWFQADALGNTFRRATVVLGTFCGTPTLYYPTSTNLDGSSNLLWGKERRPVPFAVVL